MTLITKKIDRVESPRSFEKKVVVYTIDHFLVSWKVLTPTSIVILIDLFDCALQKWAYIDQMQVV